MFADGKTMGEQKSEKGQERFFICTWQTGKRELKKLFKLFRGQWNTHTRCLHVLLIILMTKFFKIDITFNQTTATCWSAKIDGANLYRCHFANKAKFNRTFAWYCRLRASITLKLFETFSFSMSVKMYFRRYMKTKFKLRVQKRANTVGCRI